MADGGTVIGRGSLVLEDPSDSSITHLVRYAVQSSGIRFYAPPSSVEPKSLFELLPTLTSGQELEIISGHLTLVSLPASPQDAFYSVGLSTSADNDIKLRLKQAEAFAHRSSTFFKDLDVTFTESKGGGALQVAGTVTVHVLGHDIQLSPEVTTEGLVFKPSALQPTALEIAQLGLLTISTLEVGANHDRWADLQALYTFDEPNGDVFRDSSGSQSPDGIAQMAIDLKVDGDAGTVKRVPGEILIGDGAASNRHKAVLQSQGSTSKIVEACKISNALTISAWVKPTRTITEENITDDENLPARIVSLSDNTTQRNFTLGQDIDDAENNRYIVRLRRSDDKLKAL